MTTKTDDGGPAFPIAFQHRDEQAGMIEVRAYGMTLRDYFAASAPKPWKDGAVLKDLCEVAGVPYADPDAAPDVYALILQCEARMRYAYADAMLAERARKDGAR